MRDYVVVWGALAIGKFCVVLTTLVLHRMDKEIVSVVSIVHDVLCLVLSNDKCFLEPMEGIHVIIYRKGKLLRSLPGRFRAEPGLFSFDMPPHASLIKFCPLSSLIPSILSRTTNL